MCVLFQYVKSDNCMMELRFGVLTLGLPLVICVVGTGREWKQSEVSQSHWSSLFIAPKYYAL